MGELLIIVAVLLVVGGWCLSVPLRYRRAIPVWRRVLLFVALVSLTCSVVELLAGSVVLQSVDFDRRFHLIPLLALVGLVFTLVAFITCWFGHWRVFLCILPATLLVGFLWFMSVVAL